MVADILFNSRKRVNTLCLVQELEFQDGIKLHGGAV